MKKLSIRRILIIGTIAITLTVQMVFGTINYVNLLDNYNEEVIAHSHASFNSIKEHFLSKLYSPITILKYTAENVKYTDQSLVELVKYITALEKLYPFFSSVMLLDEDSVLVAQAPYNSDLINSSFINESFSTDRPIGDEVKWSNIYISAKNYRPVITLSMNFGNYLLVSDVDLISLHEDIKYTKDHSVRSISVLDDYGNYIYSDVRKNVEERMHFDNFDEIILNHQDDAPGLLEALDENVIISSRIGENQWGYLVVEMDFSVFRNQLNTYTNLLIMKILLTSIFTFIFIFVLMKRIQKDFGQLSIMSEHIIHNIDEVDPYSFSFKETIKIADDFTEMKSVVQSREEEVNSLNSELENLVIKRTKSLQEEIHERMRVERELIDLNEDLEKRVQDRTLAIEISNHQLEEINAQLEEEIHEHTHTLMALRDREMELEIALQIAKHASLAKGQFVANMSHEIRTPMNGILGMITLMDESPLTDEQSKYVRTIASSAKNLMTIINDILDYSKIESGKLQLIKESVVIRNVVEDVYQIFNTIAREKKLVFSYTISDQVPDSILIDETRLKQILNNLVGNALKFTDEGQVTMHFDVQNRAFLGDSLIIVISDTGRGIFKSDIDIIFDRFEQGRSIRNNKPQGTGLGLAITKMIVELMNGEIKCSSELGKGSNFEVIIPLTFEEVGREIDLEKAEIPKEPIVLDNFKFLLAEDDEASALIVKTILEKRGAFVDHVVNGEEALLRVKNDQFDIILLDINMPLKDGLETASEMRMMNIKSRKGDAIPIIALTAFANLEDKQNCITAGCSMHIAKPIDFNVLLDMIRFYK